MRISFILIFISMSVLASSCTSPSSSTWSWQTSSGVTLSEWTGNTRTDTPNAGASGSQITSSGAINSSWVTSDESLGHGFKLEKTEKMYFLKFAWVTVREFNPPYDAETLTEDADPSKPYFQNITITPTSDSRFYLVKLGEGGDISSTSLFDTAFGKFFDEFDLGDVESIDITSDTTGTTTLIVKWSYEDCPEWGIYTVSPEGNFTRKNASCSKTYGGE